MLLGSNPQDGIKAIQSQGLRHTLQNSGILQDTSQNQDITKINMPGVRPITNTEPQAKLLKTQDLKQSAQDKTLQDFKANRSLTPRFVHALAAGGRTLGDRSSAETEIILGDFAGPTSSD